MAQKRWGPTQAAGVAVIEKEAERLLQPGALGVTAYLAVLERGDEGKLISTLSKKQYLKRCGGRIAESYGPDCALDFWDHSQGSGELHLVRVTDGTGVKAQVYTYGRGSPMARVLKWTAHNVGRWGGRAKVIGGTSDWVGTPGNLTNTLLKTSKTLLKNELKGGKVALKGVSGKLYEIISNTTTGDVTVKSDSKMRSHFDASGSTDINYTIILDHNAKLLEIIIDDGERDPDNEFSARVFLNGELVKLFTDCSMDPESDKYVVKVVNDDKDNDFVLVDDLVAGQEVNFEKMPASDYGMISTLSATVLKKKLLQATISAATSGATPSVAVSGSTNDDMQYRDRATLVVTTAGVRSSATLTVPAASAFAAGDTDVFAVNGTIFRVVVGADASSGNNAIYVAALDTQAQVRTKIANAINALTSTHGCIAVEGSGGAITIKARYVGTYGDALTLTETVSDAGFTVSGAVLSGGVNQVMSVVSEKFGAQTSITTNASTGIGTSSMGTPYLPNLAVSGHHDMALTESIVVDYLPLVPGAHKGEFIVPDRLGSRLKRFRVADNDHESWTVYAGDLCGSGADGAGAVTSDDTHVDGDGTTFADDAEVGDLLAIDGAAREITALLSQATMVVVAATAIAAGDTDYFTLNSDKFRLVLDTDAGSANGGHPILAVTGDTQAQVRTKVAAAINARTGVHGCTATEGTGGTIYIRRAYPSAITLTENVADSGFTVSATTAAAGLTIASAFADDLDASAYRIIKRFMHIGALPLAGGYDGLENLADSHFTAKLDQGSSLFRLLKGQRKGLIKYACPGKTSTNIQKAGVEFASAMNGQYRIEIPSNLSTEDSAVDYVLNTIGRSEMAVTILPSYAYVNDQDKPGLKKLIPLTGAIHGREALVAQANGGYHKAAAGEDVTLPRVLDLPTDSMLDMNEEVLNPVGLNIVKKLSGNFVIWGDRSLSADPAWKWKHQREQMSHYECLLQESFNWIIFAINDPLQRGVAYSALRSFFFSEWQPKRALQGGSVEEAARIKIDADNNGPLVTANGDMNAEIELWLADTTERFIITMSKKGIFDSAR